MSSSRQSLDTLYAGCAQAAYRFAYSLTGNREVAADLVQEAFLRLCGRFQNLREPEKFRAYLLKTILNLSRDEHGKHQREVNTLPRLARSHDVPGPDLSVQDQLWRALQSLTVRQRAVLYFRYYEDLSEQQVAHVLGCSVGAVKSLSQRGLRKLRAEIEE
ncbi:MAG: SigE family RNA polymerase sigma factor, partial [Actinomycetota bacterium]|nr:SigE family RNA polymerase sigma factor [Actinomycetota bacterium]